MEIALEPWIVPNFVLGKMPPRPRQEGFHPDACPKWALSEVDAETLSEQCDRFRAEVFRKAGKADPRADAKKRYSHWGDRRIARVWFAVPYQLQDCPEIPREAGILSVTPRVWDQTEDGRWGYRICGAEEKAWENKVEVRRPATLRSQDTRVKVTPQQRLKLAELGAMRIWDLKQALARKRAR